MDLVTLDKLCDPFTHEPLVAQADKDHDQCLCSGGGNRYVIRDGVPVFLRDNQVQGRNLKYQRLYDSFAPFYDPVQRFVYWFFGGEARARSEYLDHIEVKPGDAVLEVSVGTGGNIRFLRRDAEYFGLDISWGQLQQCVRNQARYGFKVRLVQGEAEYPPFRDASFDVVFHVGGINFFNDKAKAVAEMVRVAKPGTKIVIIDETEQVATLGERLPFAKRFFKNRRQICAPVDCIPSGMTDVKVTYLAGGHLYCMAFRKPVSTHGLRASG